MIFIHFFGLEPALQQFVKRMTDIPDWWREEPEIALLTRAAYLAALVTLVWLLLRRPRDEE